MWNGSRASDVKASSKTLKLRRMHWNCPIDQGSCEVRERQGVELWLDDGCGCRTLEGEVECAGGKRRPGAA